MSSTLELTDRQRERIEGIKDGLKEAEPECPRATDEQTVKSLLDTWDAVGEGLYSKDREILDLASDLRSRAFAAGSGQYAEGLSEAAEELEDMADADEFYAVPQEGES